MGKNNHYTRINLLQMKIKYINTDKVRVIRKKKQDIVCVKIVNIEIL